MGDEGHFVDLLGDLPHVEAAQVRRCARALLRHPLLRADGPDAELLPLVYRHRTVLRRLFAAHLGYPLRVDRRFARLFKQCDDDGRGIPGFTPRSYMYLALTLASLVETGRQILLSQLVTNLRGAAAEGGIAVGDDPVEIRALATALRHLVGLGVLEEVEGTVAAVADVGSDEALITVDTELLALMWLPVGDSELDATHPAGRRSSDIGRAVGVLARRRAAEHPIVLYADLPVEEADYLRSHYRQESYWLERYFGLQIEARAEGIVATDPDEYLTDLSFPGGSTVARMALLVVNSLLGMSNPREVDGCHVVSIHQIRPVCVDLTERYPSAWARSELANLDALASKVTDLLVQAGIARCAPDEVMVLMPAACRWLPKIEEKSPATGLAVAENVDELTLFGDAGDIRDARYSQILAHALDYRTWYAFTVRVRDTGPDGQSRNRLLRRLSSGETRLISYVTLFAGAAAFYDALTVPGTKPLRLVLLDEAFERLDDPTITRLLELLAHLDMDWVITWPGGSAFSPRIDRMQVYDIFRPKGAPGIALVHTTWDGTNLRRSS